ncbi:CPBP family intramembrane metalloprotease [Georgenia yuyongxinii]|uniref:CPBP family intramembrane metalloprotease n=1 Tax=Georgenia yuyongxinii TaxID=2589797 RepID=A0A5B8C3H9_9MICO|nr:CPBP family glutamic-type intramembrane protease [Georgenia yuyongxinii]QDC25084.1 CPBP family intramembrane metalloprotease [Georgenia yuyongxinii]
MPGMLSGWCEKLGWTAYATDPLQDRYGASHAALVLGVAWALVHVVPYAQAGNDARWIVGQCLFTVALRVVPAWIYNNTGHSVLAVATCQASSNLAWSLVPVPRPGLALRPGRDRAADDGDHARRRAALRARTLAR